MVTVFLSHSSADKAFVRDLADALRNGGQIEVFLDEREIAAGENIVSRISDGLHVDFVLVVLSRDAMESPWVKEEWTAALAKSITLLTVMCRDCVVPPL